MQHFKHVVKKPRVVSHDTISKRVKAVEYAVRGAIVIRAQQHEQTLIKEKEKNAPSSLPFQRVTYCNIGNPQQLGQPPLTFFRQVLALVEYPQMMDNPAIAREFPSDAIKKAKEFLSKGGSIGAYSESKGRQNVRKDVAAFINLRDGYAADDHNYTNPDDIYLSDGASQAVQNSLKLLIRDEKDGIMIPIPQYPLYSATIPLLGGSSVPYYLDESSNWSLTLNELQNSVKQARNKGITPRALVVINPGNPTGACLEEKNIEEIVGFCYENGILIMADEVYQENIYGTRPFVSFKKIVKKNFASTEVKNLELLSFHSTSKGFIGECGHRGGYVEMTNIADEVKNEYLKLVSINLCSNIPGQLLTSLMTNPPRPGDASHGTYVKERDNILSSLKARAKLIVSKLNSVPGISCNPAEGALYAFPKIVLPQKFVAEANSKNTAADGLYCMQLLDHTGLCVVPGSGFGQKEGEFHFRTTFLPQHDHLNDVLEKFEQFHRNMMKKYQ